MNLSPDRRWIATTSTENPAVKARTVLAISVADGEVRELFRVPQPQNAGVILWAPDSQSVIVALSATNDRQDRVLWQVPLSGGEPTRLDWKLDNNGPPSLHPDGRRIAYASGTNKFELWVLENFLPKGAAK